MCFNLLIFFTIFLKALLSTDGYAVCHAYRIEHEQKSCRACSVEPARRDEFYQNSELQNSFFTHLEKESLQKVEALQKNPEFHETVKVLQNSSTQSQNTAVNSAPETQGNLLDADLSEASLYIFVSFSLGEKALLNIALEAKRFGATLVLRGFREGSYLKTAQSLQSIIIKTSQGVIIDPELYTLFDITAVPTFVLAKPFQLYSQERMQTPIHDKLQGHVSAHYALETFAKEGDLQNQAQAILRRGAMK